MDQLEEQVSDLRSFLGTGTDPQGPEAVMAHNAGFQGGPLAASSQATGAVFSALGDNSAQSPSPLGSQATTSKRRADDGNVDGPTAKQQRSKRNRYISIACNECKRRKIKCNGQTPCQRCGHLNLQCLYAPNCCASFKDSEEFKRMEEQVKQLQNHVDNLLNDMNALRRDASRLATRVDRVLSPPSAASSSLPSASNNPKPYPYRVSPAFNGPMSHVYSVNVAKSTLQSMGVADGGSDDDGAPDDDVVPQAERSVPSLPVPPQAAISSLAHTNLDPIWELDGPEMLRLLGVFDEEVAVMYPLIPTEELVRQAEHVTAWMDAARRNPGLLRDQEKIMTDLQTMLLKVALCSALAVEQNGNSPMAERLFATFTNAVDRMLLTDPPNVKALPFLANVAGYRYLSNDEILGWRVTGQSMRMCFELGLHRRDGLAKIKDDETRQAALHSFWATYIMDRRWSFSMGLPFTCHDEFVDPKLPLPDRNPFMRAMVGYSRLGAKTWKLVDYFEPTLLRELRLAEFRKLEAEIWEWWNAVPEEVRAPPETDKMESPMPGPLYQIQRQRIWTLLRLNQLRIWLYTTVLHSATSIAENMEYAEKAVGVAIKTVRILHHLNKETNQYKNAQIFYNQFLISSIAVLFLASAHAPAKFSSECRPAFEMGLDLVKELSSRSWVSHRLWRAFRPLKKYAPKLGLADTGVQQQLMPAPAPAPANTPVSFANRTVTAPDSYPSGVVPPQLSVPTSDGWTSLSDSAPTPEDELSGQRLQSEMTKIYRHYVPTTDEPNVLGRMAAASAVDPLADTYMAHEPTFGSHQVENGAVQQDLYVGMGEDTSYVFQHMRGLF
ncbi:hypothetical protein VTK26DRAFT_927 [Humicola hyalothermophila]